MKNTKRTAKGFTLIELIIVIALFSIILTLVMSFIDPVSKVMKKASTKERTAAYVDNIGNYLESSIHYAQYMTVFNGGYVGIEPSDGSFKNGANPCRNDEGAYTREGEKALVKKMVEDFLPYAVDSNNAPLSGRVRIIKLINTADIGKDYVWLPDGEETVAGQMYESVYTFKTNSYELDGTTYKSKDAEVNAVGFDTPLINPEHFKEYAYYYKKGYYTLDAIKEPSMYATPGSGEDADAKKAADLKHFTSNADYYYTELNPLTYNDGGTMKPIEIDPSGRSFAVSVVSYQTKRGNNKEEAVYKDPAGDVNVTLFKSPANINTVSMAMKNIDNNSFGANTQMLYVKSSVNDDKLEYQPVFRGGAGAPVKQFFRNVVPTYSEAAGLTDNIYIMYILPSEINDSYLKLGKQVAATSATDAVTP